ncbi:MAG: glycosyltransferase family A protein [Algoriphagus sp.]|nr:glycosyltransferase family A protein [Algoriphagus sp.]
MFTEFSVIIPTYNRDYLLRRAIESVLNQTYPHFELIVADDGSTDGTEKLVREYQEVHYFFQDNRGVCAARNFGAGKATKEWLVFLDSDDELTSGSLTAFFENITSNQELSVFQAGVKLVFSDFEKLEIPKKGKYNPPLSGAFTIKKTLFDRVKGYDESLKFAENTELFHRIEQEGEETGLIKMVSLIYRLDPLGSNRHLRNMSNSILIILEKHNNTLSDNTKRLYHQILGVNYLRFKEFSSARKHLLLAYRFDLKRLDTLGRYIISCFPFLAKKLYPENPRI